MTAVMSEEWSKKNQQYLVSCIADMKATLDNHPSRTAAGSGAAAWDDGILKPAIEYVCDAFGLSNFERSILLVCAATELDSKVPQMCAEAQGSVGGTYPTFSLALAVFPDAHWSALVPTGPLRRFKLIEVLGLPEIPLTKCQLRINERVLHFLTGISYLDSELFGIVSPARLEDLGISDSQKTAAQMVLDAWRDGASQRFNLFGQDEASKMAIASWISKHLGFLLWHLPGELVPTKSDEMESFAHLWGRESALLKAGLYISASELEPAIQKQIKRLAAMLPGPVFLSTAEPLSDNFPMLSIQVSKPTKTEQKVIWGSSLEKTDLDARLDAEIHKLVNQFDLNAQSIRSAAREAAVANSGGVEFSQALWSSTLKAASPRLAELAIRIVPKATMDDIVLPAREHRLLKSIVTNVRQRYRVYEEWGFGADDRGLGTSALFFGGSGTGKTLAAEVIANELNLDLFKIDLSMVVNKYIGETEKNLKRVFDAAEDGGAVLLFDEADALFGKRSEVRDSHDRHANIEVAYLLQRMETYRGMAILTTNMKSSIDNAFLRRIRFVVKFPMPDQRSRQEIWKRVFPASVQVDGLDFGLLANLDITGGHIRNIALGAAFHAAEEEAHIDMRHIRRAAQEEYDKMERPMPCIRWEG